MKASSEIPLPKSVFFKNGAYYFVTKQIGAEKQKWHRLGRSWGESFTRYQTLVPQIKNDAYLKRRLEIYQTGDIPDAHLAAMLKQSRNNARSRSLSHTINMNDLRDLAFQSNGCCALSGIKFEYGLARELADSKCSRKRPWAPSIDRIESSTGYVIENIRLVCIAVNIARQDFPDSVLYKIAAGMSKLKRKV